MFSLAYVSARYRFQNVRHPNAVNDFEIILKLRFIVLDSLLLHNVSLTAGTSIGARGLEV